ncbi:MAG TPA: GNAT family N-acetyltransferase [Flavobacterium sp.]|nr:GNAT family N-acetyltransferase [Flavobacterium sp.]
MKNYTIRPYKPTDYANWNAFVGKAKNATFLFHRDFMDYHSDRFSDYSLIVLDGEKWITILPAHLNGNHVYSHFGLTYGGLVYDEKMKLSIAIDAFRCILQFLEKAGMAKLHIKMIPFIYHIKPAEELHYALFLANAALVRRDSLSVIDLSRPNPATKTRRESIRKGIKNALVIKEETNFRLFWNKILEPNLNHKHSVKPVHTIEEIENLHRSFPENIRHFNVYHNDEIVAGTTIFVSENVAHAQYVSGQENKNELGSLDYLYDYLIREVFHDKRFFDFGISNEDNGRKVNEGLIFWKESFGAGTLTQDFYEVETANHKLLENVLI